MGRMVSASVGIGAIAMLAACDDAAVATSASSGPGSSTYIAPPEATEAVELPGRDLRRVSESFLCVPSDTQSAPSRARSALAEITRGSEAIVAQDLSFEDGAAAFDELFQGAADRTGCWFVNQTFRETVDESISVAAGSLTATQLMQGSSAISIPSGASATCYRLDGESEAQTRQRARTAAAERVRMWDEDHTRFLRQLNEGGSGTVAGLRRDGPAEWRALAERFSCTSVFLNYS